MNRIQSDCFNIGTISNAAGQQRRRELMWSSVMCVVIKMAMRRSSKDTVLFLPFNKDVEVVFVESDNVVLAPLVLKTTVAGIFLCTTASLSCKGGMGMLLLPVDTVVSPSYVRAALLTKLLFFTGATGICVLFDNALNSSA